MSERVVVPPKMLEAVRGAERGNPHFENEDAVEAALLWLDERLAKLTPVVESQAYKSGYLTAIEQVRRMFRAEPEVPEAVKDLLWSGSNDLEDEANRRTIEAYRRGLRGK